MRKRNIYKDIVFLAISCAVIFWSAQAAGYWFRQQETYDIVLQSQSELTEDVVREIGKIEGLYQFTPLLSSSVTIRMQEYTLEMALTGIDFESYPLAWQSAQKEMVLGNTPFLFLGKEAFVSFMDSNGNAPGKSQIAKWMEKYQELELTVIDERGRERGAKIGGIIEKPASGVFMQQKQMQEIYGRSAKVTGGCTKVQGEQNAQKARELLTGAGFIAE